MKCLKVVDFVYACEQQNFVKRHCQNWKKASYIKLKKIKIILCLKKHDNIRIRNFMITNLDFIIIIHFFIKLASFKVRETQNCQREFFKH